MKELSVGSPAPDFSLPANDGKTYSLKELRGKKIVLYFYPKDDTSGCTKESCSFSENIFSIKKKGALVLGVSADSVKSHQKFVEKYALQFPLLSDVSKEMLQAYGVLQQKSMFGKKYIGIVRTTFIIDEKGNIAHIFPNVKVDGHTQEVLNVL
ncbi:MAG: thioredoxin-dependent thiol peroxidase [Ignavibacteriales bacterium]|nr:thioredoxin-dependent thiol peroxidase [Ignavibacteriales bacterium]